MWLNRGRRIVARSLIKTLYRVPPIILDEQRRVCRAPLMDLSNLELNWRREKCNV